MKDKFLLRMLACIFAFQAIVFGWAVLWCGRNGGVTVCPEIGRRYENTFNVMVATTVALLTGSALKDK